jgi:hypothetical protein
MSTTVSPRCGASAMTGMNEEAPWGGPGRRGGHANKCEVVCEPHTNPDKRVPFLLGPAEPLSQCKLTMCGGADMAVPAACSARPCTPAWRQWAPCCRTPPAQPGVR